MHAKGIMFSLGIKNLREPVLGTLPWKQNDQTAVVVLWSHYENMRVTGKGNKIHGRIIES